MNLDNLVFWVTPVTKKICVGMPSKSKANFGLVSTKRDINDLIICEVAVQMIESKTSAHIVEIGDEKFKLSISKEPQGEQDE